MKQSIRTAESIYKEIKELDEDVKEISNVLDEVDHIPAAAKILKQNYEEKRSQLQKLKNTRYTYSEGQAFY